MNILIVDDVELARERLGRILGYLGKSDLFFAQDAKSAREYLLNEKIDVAFLDIEMPGESGLELADFIREKTESFIVFATAYEQYALDAFAKDGIGYLLKPFSEEDVLGVLEKIEQFAPKARGVKKILGKLGNKIFLIDIEEILYIDADLNEVIVRTQESSYYVRMKLSQIEKYLPSHFLKVHRSHIVNIDAIKSLESIEQSKYIISFKGIRDEITSSKDGAKRLREFLEK